VKVSWPIVYSYRREIVGIVLAIALVLTIFLVQLYFATHRISVGTGLGPEWDCVNPGKGNSVCIKLQKKTGLSN
jgi:hypothetical protein